MQTEKIELKGKNILITGAARRIGRHMALALARAGANIILHHAHSPEKAERTLSDIRTQGGDGYIVSADFNYFNEVQELIEKATCFGPLYALVNNASMFDSKSFANTTLEEWESHFRVNLTAPFLLSQAFASVLPPENTGRIVNMLDWRALRPGRGHFPYTISKAALATMTRAMALSLAPRITVNGLALGAILPPEDINNIENVIKSVPLKRWASLEEVDQALLFLLAGPEYITGEIIHVDGGRHLV